MAETVGVITPIHAPACVPVCARYGHPTARKRTNEGDTKCWCDARELAERRRQILPRGLPCLAAVLRLLLPPIEAEIKGATQRLLRVRVSDGDQVCNLRARACAYGLRETSSQPGGGAFRDLKEMVHECLRGPTHVGSEGAGVI